MPRPVKSSYRYMPGLDGLRALAVVAVVAYHLNLPFAPGGLLGVGIFFVLSGYLITDLLISEWGQRGHIDMKGFWLRRARRLLPALFFMLALVAVWVSLFDSAQLVTFRSDMIAGLLYISNWWFVFHHVSYFASFGRPSPLGHLWSLAVEEQFYVLWPLIVVLLLRFVKRRGRIIGFILCFAAASALLMAILYQPGTDPSRVYYGTDTRAFSLLIGSALAVVWPSRKLSAGISLPSRLALDVVGTLGILILLLMIWQTNEYETFLYRGGMVVLSLATALVVMVLAHPGTTIGKIMGCPPLRWIGARSYGIYLWHYPVIILTSPVVDTSGPHVMRSILQVAFSVLLAALSWRWIEEPIRRGKVKKTLAGMSAAARHPGRKRAGFIVASSGVVMFVIAGMSIAFPYQNATQASTHHVTSIEPDSSASNSPDIHTSSLKETQHSDEAKTNQKQQATTKMETKPGQTRNAPSTHNGTTSNKSSQGQVASTGTAGTVASTKAISGKGVTAIGDSVMIDAAPYLQQQLPGIVIAAHVGRHLTDVPAVISELKAEGKLGNRVIIEMGTNGPFTKAQLVSVLQSLGNVKQIILVNTRVPRPWEEVVNQTLAEVAASYPNTTLVNWYADSANKASYFYGDGVHLNPQGSKYYASLLINALENHH